MDWIRTEHDALRNRVLAQEDGYNKLWSFCSELEIKVQTALDQMRLDVVSKMQAQAFEEINARLAELGASVKEFPPADTLHRGLQQLTWLNSGPKEIQDVLSCLEGRLLAVEDPTLCAKTSQIVVEDAIANHIKASVSNDEHERLKETVMEACTELRDLIESKTEALSCRFDGSLQDKCQGIISQLELKADRADQKSLVETVQQVGAEDIREKVSELRSLLAGQEEAHKADQAALVDTMSKHCVEAMYEKTMELRAFVEAQVEAQRRDLDLLTEGRSKDFEQAEGLRRDIDLLSESSKREPGINRNDLDLLAASLQKSISDQCSELRESKADKHGLEESEKKLQLSWTESLQENCKEIKQLVSTKEGDLRTCISEQCSALRELKADKLDQKDLANTLQESFAGTLHESCTEIRSLVLRTESELKTMISNRDELHQNQLASSLRDMVSEAVQLKSTELTFLMDSKVAVQRKDLDGVAETLRLKVSDLMKTLDNKVSEAVQVKSNELTFLMESRVAVQKNDLEVLAGSLRSKDSELTKKLSTMGEFCQDLIQTLSDKFSKGIQAKAVELTGQLESQMDRQDKALQTMSKSLRAAFDEQCNDLRETKADRQDFEASASRRDQEKLAEALSQSCQDLSSSILAGRREVSLLEQNCADLGQNVLEYRKAVAQNDATIQELKSCLLQQNHVIGDFERHWAQRPCSYQDASDSVPTTPTSTPQRHLRVSAQSEPPQPGLRQAAPPLSAPQQSARSRSPSPRREGSQYSQGQGMSSKELAPWMPTSARPPSSAPSSYRGNLHARLWGRTESRVDHGQAAN